MGAGPSQEEAAKFREAQGAISDDQRTSSPHENEDHKTSEQLGDHVGSGNIAKSFYVPAKELSITWSEDQRYWFWVSLKTPESNEAIEAAYLVNVCWLEVHGKFDRSKLCKNTAYQVLFEVMLKDPAYGWEVPINLRLTDQDGTVQERTEKLMDIPRGRWVTLLVGEISRGNNGGKVEYSLYEYQGGKWKKGLLIKGAIIRPKM